MKGTLPVSPLSRTQVASEGMPSQEAITQTVNRYLELVAKGTADDVLTLYAADATIEDPIGSDLLRGHDAIREFYAGFQDAEKETELAELRVGGKEAAFLWHLTLNAGDRRTRISPISTMAFDEDAKITSMRAFWSPSDVRVV
jgi:steroid delta-isomerase